jgi:nucleotide-binding universal stress UspA family protein
LTWQTSSRQRPNFGVSRKLAVEQGSPAEKILMVANRSKADLIVLGVQRPSGLPEAATHFADADSAQSGSKAPSPVLTVRG